MLEHSLPFIAPQILLAVCSEIGATGAYVRSGTLSDTKDEEIVTAGTLCTRMFSTLRLTGY